jgi:hypothetical protein
VDASKARPLTDADRARFAKYLEANKYVVIDSEIKKLADEIVGPETNPVLAARKLRLGAGERRVLGEGPEEQEGVAGRQHQLLSDLPYGQLH